MSTPCIQKLIMRRHNKIEGILRSGKERHHDVNQSLVASSRPGSSRTARRRGVAHPVSARHEPEGIFLGMIADRELESLPVPMEGQPSPLTQ